MTNQRKKPVSRIAGLGRAAPERVLTNQDLEKMVDTSDEWITSRSGIKRRHICDPGTPLSDLATEASKKALDRAGVRAQDIDLIVVGTVTPDMSFPSTGNFVQAKLGAKKAASFDINAACSGFIYALQYADNVIGGGSAKNVLVIGAEILSSIMNWEDRGTCVLFGDAAGAAVLVPSNDDRGILSTYTGSNGELAMLLYMPGGGSIEPAKDRDIPSDRFTLKMSGNEVFKHAVKTMSDAAVRSIELADVKVEDIDMLVPHQANIRIIEATAKRLKIPLEKVYINIQEYGNTSAASIPVALDEAWQNGKLREGDLVCCAAFGGGFTWGASLIRF